MKKVVTGRHVTEWVAARTASAFTPDDVGIGVEVDGQIVGAVVFNDFNGVNMCIHVASDGSRKWLTREFLWFTFHYAFEQAGVRRLTGVVPESNMAARKFDEHIGFQEETRLKDAHPDGDLILYRMRKEDCRFLKMRSPNVQRFAATPA